MRGWLPMLAVVLIASAGIGWWLTKPATRTGETSDLARPSFNGSSTPEVRADETPVRLFGRVVDEKGAPIPTATVKVYAHAFAFDDAECSECGLPVWNCGAPATTRKLVEALRGNAFPTPPVIAEQPVNPDGTFSFENVPVGAVVFASAEGRHSEFGDARGGDLQLGELRDVEFDFVGDDNAPRADATATVFEPVLGTTRRLAADRKGKLDVRTADPLAWAFFEAPGALPEGERVQRDRTVHLGAPRTMVVKTMRDGAPLDADIELELSGHHFRQRSVKGVARFEGLARTLVSVTATSGQLVSGNNHVMLEDRETELVVELFEAGTLVLSLEAPDGQPVSDGFVSLSSAVLDQNQDIKPGALVTFEHVPAGDFSLIIETPAFVHEERQIEIAGGKETRLDITLKLPLLVSGRIVDSQGGPVEQHHVSLTDENGEDVDSRTRKFGEQFEEEVPHEGKFTVHVVSPLLGEGEAAATVPGPPVLLQLKAKGVLEVRVRAPDGDDLSSSVTVLPVDGWRRTYLDTPLDGGWARNASLATGDYEVIGEPYGYLPFKKKVHVVEGQTTRVDVTADPGATVSGRVVAEDGSPIANVRVSSNEKGGYVGSMTGDDGSFELQGIVAGSIELISCESNERPMKTFAVEAPARALELKCPDARRSHGRVLNKKGEPLTRFQANDRSVIAADGRFEIPWTGQLMLYAEGYTMLSLDDAGVELGDLTMESEPMVEGDVVNTDGAPVAGATVRFSRMSESARTDARGHFKLGLYTVEEVELYASLGKLSGSAKAAAGKPARIVIKPGVRVTGHIADRQGRGVIATITAESTGNSVEFRSDAQGNFAGELSEGLWIFNSRLLDGIRAVDVKGPETHVELGRSQGTCGLTVEAPGRKLFAGWLLPAKPESLDAEPAPVANAVSASARNDLIVFSGVPCGAYSAVISFNKNPIARGLEILDSLKPDFASDLITLRGENERLVLPAP